MRLVRQKEKTKFSLALGSPTVGPTEETNTIRGAEMPCEVPCRETTVYQDAETIYLSPKKGAEGFWYDVLAASPLDGRNPKLVSETVL